MRSRTTSARIRTLPVFAAFFLNVLLGPAMPFAQVVTRAAADGIDDYAQCQIGNPSPAGLDCAEKWTNGILNATHNDYAEDEVVPQRLLMDFGGPGAHSVTISYMARKDSSGQRHAYDYLATWNYTYTNADRCQTPTATDCIGGAASTFPMPSDPNSVSPGGPQPTSLHELPQADRQFVMYGGTITGTSGITHSVDPLEAGSDYGNVTVNFTVGAGGKVQLLFGGHLASGFGPRGWGENLGSGAISGGPYHIRVTAIDLESIGNRDNQIMSNAIEQLLPSLSISKTPDGGVVNAGDPISFTITVHNAGPGSATNVDIDDALPGGFEWVESPDKAECTIVANALHCDIASLASGADFSVTVTSPTQAADCGAVPNTAFADADNQSQVSDPGSVTIQCPGLNIAKSADKNPIDAGETASFEIVVWNLGPGTATNVTLHDELPGDLDWQENSDACDIVSGVLDCSFGDLGVTTMANSPARVTVFADTDRSDCGTLDNDAFADADNSDEVGPASASIEVKCPTVSILKVNNQPNPVLPGTIVSYTVTVTVSDGPANNVVVTDVLPLGLDAPTNISDGGSYAAATRTITWNLGQLGNGSRVLTYQAAVSAGTAHGAVLTNVAVVTSSNSQCPDDENIAPECDDDSTVTVRVPTLVVDKAASTEVVHFVFNADGSLKSVDPAQVTWTLTYTLTNGPVTNAVITDPLPAFLTFVSASNGGTFANGVITWNLGTLTTGGSVTFVTTVNANAPVGPAIENVATIDSTETAPDTGKDSIKVTSEKIAAATGTPAPSVPNTATGFTSNGQPITIPVELMVILFLLSLGGLTFANVRAVRRRR